MPLPGRLSRYVLRAGAADSGTQAAPLLWWNQPPRHRHRYQRNLCGG